MRSRHASQPGSNVTDGGAVLHAESWLQVIQWLGRGYMFLCSVTSGGCEDPIKDVPQVSLALPYLLLHRAACCKAACCLQHPAQQSPVQQAWQAPPATCYHIT